MFSTLSYFIDTTGAVNDLILAIFTMGILAGLVFSLVVYGVHKYNY